MDWLTWVTEVHIRVYIRLQSYACVIVFASAYGGVYVLLVLEAGGDWTKHVRMYICIYVFMYLSMYVRMIVCMCALCVCELSSSSANGPAATQRHLTTGLA